MDLMLDAHAGAALLAAFVIANWDTVVSRMRAARRRGPLRRRAGEDPAGS
jgi:hypothetical protein